MVVLICRCIKLPAGRCQLLLKRILFELCSGLCLAKCYTKVLTCVFEAADVRCEDCALGHHKSSLYWAYLLNNWVAFFSKFQSAAEEAAANEPMNPTGCMGFYSSKPTFLLFLRLFPSHSFK